MLRLEIRVSTHCLIHLKTSYPQASFIFFFSLFIFYLCGLKTLNVICEGTPVLKDQIYSSEVVL